MRETPSVAEQPLDWGVHLRDAGLECCGPYGVRAAVVGKF